MRSLVKQGRCETFLKLADDARYKVVVETKGEDSDKNTVTNSEKKRFSLPREKKIKS